jgi:hypothetical protein
MKKYNKKEIDKIFKDCEDFDYVFNGEDEIGIKTFNQDKAKIEIIEYIKKLYKDENK